MENIGTIKKDWIVTRVSRCYKPGFPWTLTGVNLNVEPGGYGRLFRWDVPDITDYRYEFGAAVIDEDCHEAIRQKRLGNL